MLGDIEMHSLLIQNPETGLEMVMNRYMALVYTIVYGKLSNVCNKQDIEETVSDIFYQIYRARNLIDLEKGSLKSYIAVVSKRAAIDIYRKQRGKNDIVSINEFEYDWIASCTDIEKDVIDSETSDLLIKEIKALGEPDSQIMIRKYYFGQTSKAIAKVLGIKENTINKKVSRALVKLQQALGGVL